MSRGRITSRLDTLDCSDMSGMSCSVLESINLMISKVEFYMALMSMLMRGLIKKGLDFNSVIE